VGLIEPRDDRLPKPLELEGHLRYTVCRQRASSRGCIETSNHASIRANEGLGGSFVSSFKELSRLRKLSHTGRCLIEALRVYGFLARPLSLHSMASTGNRTGVREARIRARGHSIPPARGYSPRGRPR
jgi:hypothetical protein